MNNHWTVYALRWAVVLGIISAIAMACVTLYWHFTKNNGVDYKDLDASYAPYNAVRANDSKEIDKILTRVSSFYEAINQEDYESALAVLDEQYVAEMQITEDSLKRVYENKYKTAVDYEIVGDTQVGNKIVLWVSETNQRLGEEEYSESELFKYRTVICYGLDNDRLSLGGFLTHRKIDGIVPVGNCKFKVSAVTISVESTSVELDVSCESDAATENPINRVFLNTKGGEHIEAGRMSPGWGISLEPGETRSDTTVFRTNYADPPIEIELYTNTGERMKIPLAQ